MSTTNSRVNWRSHFGYMPWNNPTASNVGRRANHMQRQNHPWHVSPNSFHRRLAGLHHHAALGSLAHAPPRALSRTDSGRSDSSRNSRSSSRSRSRSSRNSSRNSSFNERRIEETGFALFQSMTRLIRKYYFKPVGTQMALPLTSTLATMHGVTYTVELSKNATGEKMIRINARDGASGDGMMRYYKLRWNRARQLVLVDNLRAYLGGERMAADRRRVVQASMRTARKIYQASPVVG